ncbi:J domain-containing protein [Anabaena sp. PCC 7108]|uniref:J domain-containing protein n=1 Tax=Anabaena sp. PCC 7108 TaxID=163908 RepID=UPI00034C9CBA|nr:J domain-containing protein [Anabaena sp. PCC 7108]
MSQNFLPPEALELLIDPYSVLGVSVNANDHQVFKRYHALAKQLHPDNYINSNKLDAELGKVILTRLINPAYQELKHTKKRLSIAQTLRSKAIDLDKQSVLGLQAGLNLDIMSMSPNEAEFFYEKAITSYASAQYKSLLQSHQVTKKISQLNLVYLSLHKKDALTTEQWTTSSKSIIPRPEIKPVELKLPQDKNLTSVPINYARRNYERAVQYGEQGKWDLAVQELRDAIKLEPNNSDYYALLGVVHFQQKFTGMAKVYIRQALKLNPKQPLALKYAAQLNIQATENGNPKSVAKAVGIAALLNRFFSRKDS